MFKKLFNSISTAAKTGSQMANVQTILLRNYRVALEKNNLQDLQAICKCFGETYNNDELAVIYLLKICSEFNLNHPNKDRTVSNWIKIVHLADGDGVLNQSLVDEFLSTANSILAQPITAQDQPSTTSNSEPPAITKPALFTSEQSFPTEAEAIDFSNWIKGTSDNPEISIFRESTGNWVVRSTEKSYQEDDPSGWPK
jgi:hypothetical protein